MESWTSRMQVAVAVALLAFAGFNPVLAQDAEALDNAIGLFAAGQYIAAQEALVAIDRTKLSEEQQSLRDDYLSRTQVAITMNEKAVRDLEDAETAMGADEKEDARRLLESVLANEYAAAALRSAADAHLRSLGVGAVPIAKDPAAHAQAPKGRKVNGQRARILTEEGDEFVRAAQYEQARQRYEEALSATPGYPEAMEGLARVVGHERTLSGTRGESLIERTRRSDQINWQRTVSEYRDVERLIRDHVAGERFPEAGQLIARARQIVAAGAQYADPVTKFEGLRNEADSLTQWVQAEERVFNERKVADMQQQVEQQRRTHLREVAERRSRQVDMLMDQAQQHRKDGDLAAAINVLKQVTVIDRNYKPARWLMDDWEDLQQYRLGRKHRKDMYEQTRRSLNDVEEAKIPWHELVRYPEDWPEVIARPERQRLGGNRRRSRLFGALDKRIPVDFADDPFDVVVERLADAHNVNFIVNWNDLEKAGVKRNVPIDLRLPQEITLKRALTEVLEQAGAGVVEVGYDVSDEAVKIATRHTLDRETYTSVYDIIDLLMEIPMFNDAPQSDLRKITTMAADHARKLDGMNRPWQFGDDDDDEPDDDPARSRRINKIIGLIQETVAPDSWYDRGGSIGTMKEFNGQLVITQNSAAQQQIGNLLGKLREQRAIQIAVESRFVTVTSNYLEEMGIDIDIVLNSGNAGFDFVPTGQGALTDPVLGNALLLPRSFSRLGFTPNVPGLGTGLVGGGAIAQPNGNPVFVQPSTGGSGRQGTPVPIINQVNTFTDVSGLGSDISGSFAGATAPAFSLFGSFLDNIQVDFLIRATQADARASVVTAPRLVLFNGQRSWVAVTVQQNFISQLNPVVATGAVAQAPQTATIDAGAVMDVTASVTADKRYVTMTIRPGVTRLLDIQTIPFSGGGAGGGFGGGTALNAFIQLPQLQSQRLQTTVSVPDGGTLLIGGQKLASETELEAGVPVLSKIPVLKRLYSSRTLVKDEQTLLILVKPKILIQTEQEEQAFPSFGG